MYTKKQKTWFFIGCLILLLFSIIFKAHYTGVVKENYGLFVISLIEDTGKNIGTYVSIGITIIDYIYIISTNKEEPKIRSILSGIWLFTLSFSFQCISDCFPEYREKSGVIGIIFVVCVYHIFYNYFRHGNENQIFTGDIEKGPVEKAISSYIKRKMKKTRRDITSIQLYKFEKSETDNKINYAISYIDSSVKKGENLNAILSTQLSISKENYHLFKGFASLYNNYLLSEDDTEQYTYSYAMENLSTFNISKIKTELNSRISSAKNITMDDCCESRLILTYLSCLASLDNKKRDHYVGVRCESLNICSGNSDEEYINKQLFSKFRTGVLGALLLENQPYVFYYEHEQNEDKMNRRYIAFVLQHQKSNSDYLIIISFDTNNTSDKIQDSLYNAIKSIEEECIKICGRYEVKKND